MGRAIKKEDRLKAFYVEDSLDEGLDDGERRGGKEY